MFDPVTVTAVLTTATSAFNNLKKAFAIGRDIETMSSDLSRWMQASSDIDQGIKNSKHPPFYKKFLSGDSVEQAAVQCFTAKKQLEEQRYELQQFIKFKYGSKAWDQLLKMEANIRKERTEKLYAKQKFRQQCIEGFFILLLLCTIVGFIIFVIWLKRQSENV
tara:strand:+ start:4045 stop:4533 length:489 start_codon:yes stop_codon:yes gene_type:complete